MTLLEQSLLKHYASFSWKVYFATMDALGNKGELDVEEARELISRLGIKLWHQHVLITLKTMVKVNVDTLQSSKLWLKHVGAKLLSGHGCYPMLYGLTVQLTT